MDSGTGDESRSVIMRRPSESSAVLYDARGSRTVVHPYARKTSLADPSHEQAYFSRLAEHHLAEAASASTDLLIDRAVYEQALSTLGTALSSAPSPHTGHHGEGGIPQSAFNQGYYARFFREGRRLGRGARGTVHLAHHVLGGAVLGTYAVKKVPVGDNAAWLARVLREVRVLETLRHPNVIAYKHAWLEVRAATAFCPAVPALFILMEYADGGTLEDLVQLDADDVDGGPRVPNALLPVADVVRIFAGAAHGLAALHSLGVVHRDLKPANVLLRYAPGRVSRPDAVLADLGECAAPIAPAPPASRRTGHTGTIEFVAPELLRTGTAGEPGFATAHSPATDAWALGMTLFYALYGGRLPWAADLDDIAALRDEMLAFSGGIAIPTAVRSDVPVALVALMRELLCVNPCGRLSAAEAARRAEAIIDALESCSDVRSAPVFPALTGAVSLGAEHASPPVPARSINWRPAVIVLALSGYACASVACYPQAVSLRTCVALLALCICTRTPPLIFPFLCAAVFAIHGIRSPCACSS